MGYEYPVHQQGPIIDHINVCNDALYKTEEFLKQTFSDFEVKVDETGEFPHSFYSSTNFTERPWNEKNTAPLFKDSYLKALFMQKIGMILRPFKDIGEVLLSLVYKDQKNFCDTMNSWPDFFHEKVTQKERIMILESKKGEQVVYTVTPRRQRYGANGIGVLKPGYARFWNGIPIPIMIQLKRFKSNDKKFRERHEILITHDFAHLKRNFPHVPDQISIENNKYRQIILNRAEHGEYIPRMDGDSFHYNKAEKVIDQCLEKGLVTYKEIAPFIQGLYDKSVNADHLFIKKLELRLSAARHDRSKKN